MVVRRQHACIDQRSLCPVPQVLLDFGLAEELTPRVRKHFLSFLYAIGAGNGAAGARHMLAFGVVQARRTLSPLHPVSSWDMEAGTAYLCGLTGVCLSGGRRFGAPPPQGRMCLQECAKLPVPVLTQLARLRNASMQACPDPLAFQRDVEALFRASCDIHSPQGINVDLVRCFACAPSRCALHACICDTRGLHCGRLAAISVHARFCGLAHFTVGVNLKQ